MSLFGKVLTLPGAIDLHVHLREPGTNKAETIRSGSKAAMFGGFTMVCDMPNNPGNPMWSLERLEQKRKLIARKSLIPIAMYAGAQPESDNLPELPRMAPLSIGLKLYGAPTTGNENDYNAGQFAEIVKVWHKAAPNKPIMLHSGRDNLEEFIDLIAKRQDHQLHVCHLFSVKQALIVDKARKKGLAVTSGVCPHHLLKSSHETLTEGWFARMQPPLLHQDESEELFKLFATGLIDVLETDHAPHSLDAKLSAEEANPGGLQDAKHLSCYGVPGIEFALPLMFYQVVRGRLGLDRLIDAVSIKPSKIVGVKIAKQTKVTWDMSHYRIGQDNPKGISAAGWTPYANNLAIGKIKKVVIGSRTIFDKGRIDPYPRVALKGETI